VSEHVRCKHLAAASAIAIGAMLVTAVPASAQETPAATPAGASQEEEVVVTGTRIRGSAPVGSPLIEVQREDIEAANALTTSQLLQEQPQVFNLGVSESSRGQSGGSSNITYGSTVNVRGIGPFATLVLVDGHRAVPQGTSGFAIDPSIIPTMGLARVDIVADGASAIYGSDAVAGVVNLILRRNLEGAEFSLKGGWANSYDERQAGLAWGHKWSSGQFSFAYENGYHSNLNGRDRSFFRADLSASGGGDFRQTLCNPGNIVIAGVSYAIPAGGVTAANRSALTAGTANKCDNLKIADLLPRQNHNSASFTLDQEVTDRISLFAEGLESKRDFKIYGGAAASSVSVPSTNAFFVAPPGLSPASETVQYSFINDYPQGYSDGFSRSVNVTFGGDIRLPYDWKGVVDYTWGSDEDDSSGHNAAAGAVLTAALNSRDPTTAFNVFGAGNSAAVINSILVGYSLNKGNSIFRGWEATADGPLFRIPGGEVRAAFGYEGQRLTVDQLNLSGTITAITGSPRFFARNVNSVYGELSIPLVGPDNAMAAIRSVDLDIAGRYDNYSDVGNTRNPKIGLNWSPVEGLTLHGSWGTSFRAPGIAQIYGNTNTLFIQNYSDPTCGCIRQGVTRSGGNLNLKPETARTWSIGADWSPSSLPNAHLEVTYFDVKYENQVANFLADLTVLNRESQFAGTGIIVRNPSAALIAQQLAETGFSGVLPNPVTLFVDGRNFNTGLSITHGVDFQATYRIPTSAWGDFLLSASGTRFTKYETALTPSAPLINYLNVIFNPLKFKSRVGARWTDGPALVSLYWNHLNSYQNNLATPAQSVGAYDTVDLQATYNLGDHLSVKGLTFGVYARNLFNEQPPFVNIAQSPNGGGGFDPTTVDPVGRVLGVLLNVKL
jgi:iron complex outermembrane receptor protein